MSEGRIVWANYSRCELVNDLPLPMDCFEAFSLSADRRLLATGYWYRYGVDLWEFPSGKHLDRFRAGQVWRVLLHPGGRYLVILAEKKKVIRDLETGTEEKIRGMEDLYGACYDPKSGSLWIPLSFKRKMARLNIDPFSIETVCMPYAGAIWNVRLSPTEDSVISLEWEDMREGRRLGRITCYDQWFDRVRWTRVLYGDDVGSNGSFTIDGKLFALYASGESTLFDTTDGTALRRIREPIVPEYPFEHSQIMSAGGDILDVTSGEIAEGCSKPDWWRKAGLAPGRFSSKR